jgi:hypothetical protein
VRTRTVQGIPVGMGSIVPSARVLSGGYRFRGFEDWRPGHPAYAGLTGTDEDGGEDEDVEVIDPPSVIVARLHEQIAAKSPDLAALVAEYARGASDLRRLRESGDPRGNDLRKAERDARMRRYAGLRASGRGKKAARDELGISQSTAIRYEADMHLVREGES